MEDSAHDWPQNAAAAPARHRASPLVRRLAAERGIDLGALAGSGPGGRIVQRDLPRPRTSKATGTAPQTGGVPAGKEIAAPLPPPVTLRRLVALGRLEAIRAAISDSHGPVPLAAFAAKALLRLAPGPLALATGFEAPRTVRLARTDPLTAFPGADGAGVPAATILVDLGAEGLSGGDLPLPDGATLLVVLGTPHNGAVEVSFRARENADALAARLNACADLLERPGALLSGLPEV